MRSTIRHNKVSNAEGSLQTSICFVILSSIKTMSNSSSMALKKRKKGRFKEDILAGRGRDQVLISNNLASVIMSYLKSMKKTMRRRRISLSNNNYNNYNIPNKTSKKSQSSQHQGPTIPTSLRIKSSLTN